MRKIIILLAILTGTAMAVDRAGQGNMVTVTEAVTQVYNEMANYTSSPEKGWDTTSVLRALEPAQQATCDRFDACKRDTTINVVTTIESYSLPSDFNRIRYTAAIAKDTPYEIVMKEMLPTQKGLFRDAEGIPAKYIVDDPTSIHVEPANTSGDTLRVYYVANGAAIDSVQDTLNIDRPYLNYLVLDAMERLWRGSSTSNEKTATVIQRRIDEVKALKETEAERLIKYNVGSSILEDIMK